MMLKTKSFFYRGMLVAVLGIGVSGGIVGCTTFKQRVGDHSLDYTQTRRLTPIELPVGTQTLPFTPMYHVPEAGANTLKLANATGTRFELPAPVSSVRPQSTSDAATAKR